MLNFLRQHALFLAAAILITGSTQLMSASVSNPALPRYGAQLVNLVLSPLQKVHHEFTQSTSYVWKRYLWLIDVEEERNELRAQLRELENVNSRLLEFEKENGRLRTILKFGESTGYRGVTATVIGRDPSNWVRTVVIDRGSQDGIRSGMAVVDGNAVVGQTSVVSDHSTIVLLLTDPSSAIDGLLQGTRIWGIIEGMGRKDLLRLRYVEKRDGLKVQAGDRIIASGLDQVFPKGTGIGVVHRVNSKASNLFYEIEVQPSVDVNRLENLYVVIPEEPVVGIAKDGGDD